MKTIRTTILCAAAMFLAAGLRAGEITAGSVPGTINYQGRLERDNAPITGTIHLYFRIYTTLTGTGTGACGAVAQPCLWQSPELTVEASQGIFSANLSPDISVFAGAKQLYLEVQVESDVLSPREPINSVVYALVAKKLEDGASVSVSSFTAAYQVLLATTSGSSVGIGTNSPLPSAALTVNGIIKVTGSGSGICYNNGTCTYADGVATAVGGVAAPGDGSIATGVTDGAGNMYFVTTGVERMRINDLNHGGRIGIGTDALVAPNGTLDIDGNLYIGNEGIYDRDDGELNVKQNLLVEGGTITGMNSESLRLGLTDNVIALVSGGAERMRVHSNGYVGLGLASPAEPVHAAGNIRSNTGVRGGTVSLGAYNGDWTGLTNEVRAQTGTALLLQQSNPYNVGIGTDTPREKLHVRGSVRSDYGVIAATGAFSGAVSVDGNFTANSGLGNTVNLSSTVIYGTLQVTGGIGSMAGLPAYITSTQTFTGLNTFQNQVTVSSDIVTLNRVGAGVSDFDFAGNNYLQVGDNKAEFANNNAMAYLVGGGNANAKLNFYRGAAESARLETQGGQNLALVVNGQTKTLTDATYHRIQNSVVWISTGYAGTPSIFVSSYMGNVGMGTTVLDPNWRLTVNGNLRISGPTSNGIIFADGTTLTTAGGGSASAISNNNDAVVRSDADQSGGGDVVLQAGSLEGLILKSGGNVGIGTVNPVAKLNVRGGDLVLGNPVNPYSGDSVEDLIVGGNIVFDGSLLQRSAYPAVFSGLIVPGDVYLSTGTLSKTGVGTSSPYTLFDVNGSAQFGQGLTKSTFTAAGVLQLASSLAPAYGGTGIAGAGGVNNRVLRTSNGTTWTAGQAVLTTDVTGILPVANGGTNSSTALSGNSIMVSNGTSIVQGDKGTTTTLLHGNAAGAPSYSAVSMTADVTGVLPVANGGTNSGTGLSGSSIMVSNGTSIVQGLPGTATTVLHGNASGTPTYSAVSLTSDVTNTLPVANGGTGATTLTGVLRGNGTSAVTAMTGAAGYAARWNTSTLISSGTITDDGSDAGVGVTPTAGIKLDVNGKLRTTTFQMTNGSSNNYVLTSDADGNASWSNPASGSLGDGWVGNEITNVTNTTLTRSGGGTLGSPFTVGLNLGNPNTWTAAQQFDGGITGNLTGNVSGTSANVTGTVAVANGGTGTTSLTSNGVLLGGASVSSTAVGAANTVLRGTGAAPTFGSIDSNYTTGGNSSADFEVIVSTQGTGTCRTMHITNGLVTTMSTAHSCY